MKIKIKIGYLFVFLLLPLLMYGGENEKTDAFAPLRYFVGQWQGHETGKAGTGKGARRYSFIMEGKYLYQQNISKFAPQEKNPQGETHEDRAFFSFDTNRKQIILREFNSEGFVNTYALIDTLSGDSMLVFVSKSSENAPPGLRARITLQKKNKNEFIESFDLAMPGKDFQPWLKNYWTRIEKSQEN